MQELSKGKCTVFYKRFIIYLKNKIQNADFIDLRSSDVPNSQRNNTLREHERDFRKRIEETCIFDF